jgi:hypothetical protein
MKMKKIDLSGVKEYLFQKGERVGLAVCGVIALLLIVMGVMKVSSAGASYAKDFETIRKPIDVVLNRPATVVIPPKEKSPPSWVDQPVRPIESSPYMVNPDAPDNKSRNPDILAIPDDAEHMSAYFLKGGVYAYDADKSNLVVSKAKKPMLNVQPVRMIVVTAVYPMRLLWQEYHQQLSYIAQAELEKDDQPKPLGLIVDRREVKADGKATDWENVYWVKDDKVEMPERLSEFFRTMVVEPDNQEALKNHLMRGLATPLPKLANAKYEQMTFKDIKELPITPAAVLAPGAKGPSGNIETEKIPIDQLKDQNLGYLGSQLTNKIDYFNADGLFEGEAAPKVVGSARPQRYVRPGTIRPPTTINTEKITVFDKLIRFIDVGVEPGKTYEYSVKVRFANPNFDKKDEVLYQDLASIKELESPWATTPPITVPEEFHYYAFDEKLNPYTKISGGSDHDPAKSEPPTAYGLWNTPVQIHTWQAIADDQTVADWAIAERLLVRRGDIIGKPLVMVEVPVWDKAQQKFKIGSSNALRGKKSSGQLAGMPIKFIRDNPPPMLVDFAGGPKHSVKIGKSTIRDESAVEMLILTTDGKLIVRNSRIDSDASEPVGAEREQQFKAWHAKIEDLRKAAMPVGKGGGAGLPGGFQLPGGNK